MASHEMAYRVSYGDTDRMGRVYYANYLEICERARTELLRECGFPYLAIENRGCFFPVRDCHIRYYNYAVYDDVLICRTSVSKMRHATLTFTTGIYRGDDPKPLVTAAVELACIGGNGKPTVIPDDLRASLAPFLADGLDAIQPPKG